jgi:hypothetical protein
MLRVPLAILATSVLLAAACGGEESAVGILPQEAAAIAESADPSAVADETIDSRAA